MNTTFLLMSEHNTADIPLETVAEKYLGIGSRVAAMRASKSELPFPAYRPGGSQKSPWLVRVTDLAVWLDAERAKAAADVEKRRVA